MNWKIESNNNYISTKADIKVIAVVAGYVNVNRNVDMALLQLINRTHVRILGFISSKAKGEKRM